MKIMETLKNHPRHFIIPFICLMITFYFTYHAIRGERGLFRLFEIQKEIAEAELLSQETTNLQTKMEKKVKALSPGNLDLDLLEESGRKALNVGDKNDYIIFD